MGATILALAPVPHRKRELSRALQSTQNATYFVEDLNGFLSKMESVAPQVVILDCDACDPKLASGVVEYFHRQPTTASLMLLSFESDKQRLMHALTDCELPNLLVRHGGARGDGPSFEATELLVGCDKLVRRSIFGLEKYVGAWGAMVHRATLKSLQEKATFLDKFEAHLESLECTPVIAQEMLLAVEELLLNAIVHSPRFEEAAKTGPIELAPELQLEPSEHVDVVHASNGEKLFVSVTDHHGSLSREALKRYLFGRIKLDATLVPEQKPTGAGLGLTLALHRVHHLVVNVQPGERTEFIAGWRLRPTSSKEFQELEKSINIFWLPPASNVSARPAQTGPWPFDPRVLQKLRAESGTWKVVLARLEEVERRIRAHAASLEYAAKAGSYREGFEHCLRLQAALLELGTGALGTTLRELIAAEPERFVEQARAYKPLIATEIESTSRSLGTFLILARPLALSGKDALSVEPTPFKGLG